MVITQSCSMLVYFAIINLVIGSDQLKDLERQDVPINQPSNVLVSRPLLAHYDTNGAHMTVF